MSEATRAWLYRISLAVITVLVVYGVVTEEQAAAFAALALAAANTGLAVVNTSTKGEQ